MEIYVWHLKLLTYAASASGNQAGELEGWLKIHVSKYFPDGKKTCDSTHELKLFVIQFQFLFI